MMERSTISTTDPDWTRENKSFVEWNPPKSLLASIRSYQTHTNNAGFFSPILRRIAVIRHRFWSAITGADIPLNSRIGGGLLIPHPNGIVIHPGVEIGPNCLIFQQVTVGANTKGIPTIGGHVDIGAGAKIIGPITIGDDVQIGANALVIDDIPNGATVVAPKGKIHSKAPKHLEDR